MPVPFSLVREEASEFFWSGLERCPSLDISIYLPSPSVVIWKNCSGKRGGALNIPSLNILKPLLLLLLCLLGISGSWKLVTLQRNVVRTKLEKQIYLLASQPGADSVVSLKIGECKVSVLSKCEFPLEWGRAIHMGKF